MIEISLVLDRTGSDPLPRQLADQLRDAASRGVIRVGERLPSTRDLARTLGVSRTVTAAAYDQLYAEGWLVGRRGSGTYVAGLPPRPAAVGDGSHSVGTNVDAGADPGAGAAEASVVRVGFDEADDGLIDLRPGSAWAAGLRQDAWRRAWRHAADAGPDARVPRAGLPGFRTMAAELLLRHRGVVGGGDVLATSGTTAALTEIAQAVFKPGAVVAVEEPGYPRAVTALRAAGLRVHPVPVDADGLIVEAVPDGVAAIYCTPAHQFPIGGRMPAPRRLQLVAWARRNGAWIVEDDYDGELRYDVAPLPVLAAMAPDVVIHLGTASKIVSPALGVGWMVAPPPVAEMVLAHRQTGGPVPPVAGQRVLLAFAESGDLARHLRRLRRELVARRDLVVAALHARGDGVVGDRAGAHVTLMLDGPESERSVVEAVRASGVCVEGLARHFVGTPVMAGVTVGYTAPGRRDALMAGLTALLTSVSSVT